MKRWGKVFDDVVKDEYSVWTQVCDKHFKEMLEINTKEVTEHADMWGGAGTCGVKGCWEESDHYVSLTRYSNVSEESLKRLGEKLYYAYSNKLRNYPMSQGFFMGLLPREQDVVINSFSEQRKRHVTQGKDYEHETYFWKMMEEIRD